MSRALLTVAVAFLLASCASAPRLTPAQQAALPGDHIVVIGDSYTVGVNNDPDDPDLWPAMVWSQLRERHYEIQPTVEGEGGGGYAHIGTRGGVFADRLDAIQPSTDLVVIFGSPNDVGTPPDDLRAAVRRTLAGARAAGPAAHLLVIGPAWPQPDPQPPVWQVRDIVRAEAAAVGATFVDPLAQRWWWDDPNLIGWDRVHPNRAGNEYLAQRILPLIEAQLPPP
ncbi:SGNH/GDSL hydrolase family protein [Mycobacterium sp. M26]|uniref:SGNH/GDSL hydrolase family protein n=1 Tax=Mycobacterium sp. M26 TaxID=1762962 RepID=UPI0009E88C13|nr:SGNH/GDSL hydrolase family protein [Mycobacterium sp. M26]